MCKRHTEHELSWAEGGITLCKRHTDHELSWAEGGITLCKRHTDHELSWADGGITAHRTWIILNRLQYSILRIVFAGIEVWFTLFTMTQIFKKNFCTCRIPIQISVDLNYYFCICWILVHIFHIYTCIKKEFFQI